MGGTADVAGGVSPSKAHDVLEYCDISLTNVVAAINFLYYPKSRSSQKSRKIVSRGYISEGDADSEINLFRFAVKRDGARQPSLRKNSGIITEQHKSYVS